MTERDDMITDSRTIEGELGGDPAVGLLAAYVELRALLDALDPDQQHQLAAAYRKISKRRAYDGAADQAADLAYDGMVDEQSDRVDRIAGDVAELRPLTGEAEHPLGGYGFDLALAVLAYDRLDPDAWSTITEAWRAAGLGLPTMPARPRPRVQAPPPPRPVERTPARPVGRRPGGPAPLPDEPEPFEPPPPPPSPPAVISIDPVHEVIVERAARRMDAKALRRWANVLVALIVPTMFVAVFAAGYLTSWVPLVLGVFATILLAVFASINRAKAHRA